MPMLASILLASQAAGMAPGLRPADVPQRPLAFRECVAVRVGLPAGRRVPSRMPAFSARDVAEIEFTARGQRSLAGRGLELRVFLPDGHLYQKIAVPDPAAPTSRAAPASRALVRREPAGGASRRLVTARFPLAGTAITMSSLYGTWSIVPYLDGLPAACSSSRFMVSP